MTKLYCIEVLDEEEDNKFTWETLSYSFSTDKLQKSIYLKDKTWNIGTPDPTNNKNTVLYTEENVYPQYFIREVNFII